jgi:hypothetical protein
MKNNLKFDDKSIAQFSHQIIESLNFLAHDCVALISYSYESMNE